MNRRRLFAITAVVLAVPLFAWPIAFPPPDPPDRLVHQLNPTLDGGGDAVGGAVMESTSVIVDGSSNASPRESTGQRTPPLGTDETLPSTSSTDGISQPGRQVIAYDDLTDDGKRIFDAAIDAESTTYEVPVGEGAPADFTYNDTETTFVEYRNTTYMMYAWQRPTGPPLGALVPRFGSLVLGVILGMTGGYLIVSNE